MAPTSLYPVFMSLHTETNIFIFQFDQELENQRFFYLNITDKRRTTKNARNDIKSAAGDRCVLVWTYARWQDSLKKFGESPVSCLNLMRLENNMKLLNASMFKKHVEILLSPISNSLVKKPGFTRLLDTAIICACF